MAGRALHVLPMMTRLIQFPNRSHQLQSLCFQVNVDWKIDYVMWKEKKEIKKDIDTIHEGTVGNLQITFVEIEIRLFLIYVTGYVDRAQKTAKINICAQNLISQSLQYFVKRYKNAL